MRNLSDLDQSLMDAARTGNYRQALNALKQGAQVDAWDGDDTPLTVAVHWKHYSVVRLLLAHEASINANIESDEDLSDESEGATALMMSVHDMDMFKMLLCLGSDQPALGRRDWKGNALIDQVPERNQSTFHEILSRFFGTKQQQASLRKEIRLLGVAPRTSKKLTATGAQRTKTTPKKDGEKSVK